MHRFLFFIIISKFPSTALFCFCIKSPWVMLPTPQSLTPPLCWQLLSGQLNAEVLRMTRPVSKTKPIIPPGPHFLPITPLLNSIPTFLPVTSARHLAVLPHFSLPASASKAAFTSWQPGISSNNSFFFFQQLTLPFPWYRHQRDLLRCKSNDFIPVTKTHWGPCLQNKVPKPLKKKGTPSQGNSDQLYSLVSILLS